MVINWSERNELFLLSAEASSFFRALAFIQQSLLAWPARFGTEASDLHSHRSKSYFPLEFD